LLLFFSSATAEVVTAFVDTLKEEALEYCDKGMRTSDSKRSRLNASVMSQIVVGRDMKTIADIGHGRKLRQMHDNLNAVRRF